jgi:YVTN family beta-propeller protein
VISRRSLLVLPLAAAACSRGRQPGFRGYAFIANQEGHAVAAVDLEVMAVARHIPLGDAPTQVVAAASRPAVYALTPATGAIHEILVDQLKASRKATVATTVLAAALSADEQSLFVLASQPRALVSVAHDTFRALWRLALPGDPIELAIAPVGGYAAVSIAGSGAAGNDQQGSVWLVDLNARRLRGPLYRGDFGALRFLSDGKTLIAANRGERKLSLFDVASGGLITHLPLPLRPDHLCFNRDGGQLYVTGEGMDAVVIVYPYHTPEVGLTVLAGHAPGAMAASQELLFIASPSSGDVSILRVATQKVIAVVQVGVDPGFVAITPDDQYALVLNRASGDVAVLRVATITPNRYKSASLLTVIPVGSRPVSAAVRSV